MKRRNDTAPAPPPGQITIEDDGLSMRGYAMLALSAGAFVLCVALSVAIWKVATGIKWALLVMSLGYATQTALVGLGIYRRHELAGRAQLEEAKGNAYAARARGQAAVLEIRRSIRALDNQGGR